LAQWLVPCLPFPGLPHIYFLFTARLRIFHVCRNENFRNRYFSFYWKKWFYIWYMALAWWLVPCLPFPDLPHDLEFFMYAVMKTFVTDISASTGRNDFIFDTWLWHGDLYRVSPFKVYCTSTSSLPCDLRIFHVFTAFSGNECWDIYKFDTNEWVGVFVARRSVQHLVLLLHYEFLELVFLITIQPRFTILGPRIEYGICMTLTSLLWSTNLLNIKKNCDLSQFLYHTT
jgi:hypothetical protein